MTTSMCLKGEQLPPYLNRILDESEKVTDLTIGKMTVSVHNVMRVGMLPLLTSVTFDTIPNLTVQHIEILAEAKKSSLVSVSILNCQKINEHVYTPLTELVNLTAVNITNVNNDFLDIRPISLFLETRGPTMQSIIINTLAFTTVLNGLKFPELRHFMFLGLEDSYMKALNEGSPKLESVQTWLAPYLGPEFAKLTQKIQKAVIKNCMFDKKSFSMMHSKTLKVFTCIECTDLDTNPIRLIDLVPINVNCPNLKIHYMF